MARHPENVEFSYIHGISIGPTAYFCAEVFDGLSTRSVGSPTADDEYIDLMPDVRQIAAGWRDAEVDCIGPKTGQRSPFFRKPLARCDAPEAVNDLSTKMI